jgi:hypothetical protein
VRAIRLPPLRQKRPRSIAPRGLFRTVWVVGPE